MATSDMYMQPSAAYKMKPKRLITDLISDLGYSLNLRYLIT